MAGNAKVSKHWQFLEAVAARMRSLRIVADTSVVVRKAPWDRNFTKPGVLVSLGPKRRVQAGALGGINATNHSIVVGYGALVSIVQVSNQDITPNDAWMQWRERAENAFTPRTGPAMAGLPWVEDLLIEEGPTIDLGQLAAQLDVQGFTVFGICRERRGQE